MSRIPALQTFSLNDTCRISLILRFLYGIASNLTVQSVTARLKTLIQYHKSSDRQSSSSCDAFARESAFHDVILCSRLISLTTDVERTAGSIPEQSTPAQNGPCHKPDNREVFSVIHAGMNSQSSPRCEGDESYSTMPPRSKQQTAKKHGHK